MAKRKGKKISSTLTWKAVRGFFRLLFQGIFKASPLLLFGLMGLGIFWGIRSELYADPGFLVERVEVAGEEFPLEKIRHLEGLYRGQNLFKISLRKVSGALEKDPSIREARVIRQFPRALRIEVTWRNPFAQIQLNYRGPSYAVGEDGVLLDQSFARSDTLLLVEGVEPKGFKPELGEKFPLPGLDEGLALAKAFWAHPLGKRETIESLRLDRLGNVSLKLKKGPELRFGRDPLGRLNMLEATAPLLKGEERSQIVYIELQYQDLIVRKR